MALLFLYYSQNSTIFSGFNQLLCFYSLSIGTQGLLLRDKQVQLATGGSTQLIQMQPLSPRQPATHLTLLVPQLCAPAHLTIQERQLFLPTPSPRVEILAICTVNRHTVSIGTPPVPAMCQAVPSAHHPASSDVLRTTTQEVGGTTVPLQMEI